MNKSIEKQFNNLKDEVMSGVNKLKKPVTDTKDIVVDKVNNYKLTLNISNK